MPSISKSMIKASDCEYFFAGYYIKGAPQIPREFTETGLAFHDYRCKYVNHLIDKGMDKDSRWVEIYVKERPLSEDARELIMEDALGFALDWNMVYATECFLCIDKDFRPLEGVKYPGPGRQPDNPNCYAHGSIDRIDLLGESEAVIHDYKSGFLVKTDEREAAVYALLTFCHFPWIKTVRFSWDFTRSGSTRKAIFERELDMDFLKAVVMAAHQSLRLLGERINNGAAGVNPFAGLCTYCDLVCPLRDSAAKGQIPTAPLQSEADALRAIGILRAINKSKKDLEAMVKAWLDRVGSQETAAGVAKMNVGKTIEVPLSRLIKDAYEIDLPEISPVFDGLAAEDLRVGLTELKKAARGNPELADLLESYPSTASSRLSLGKASD